MMRTLYQQSGRTDPYPDDFANVLWRHVLLLRFHVAVLAFLSIALCVQLLPLSSLDRYDGNSQMTALHHLYCPAARLALAEAHLFFQQGFRIHSLRLLHRCWRRGSHDRVAAGCCASEGLRSVTGWGWWSRPTTGRLHAGRHPSLP